ncbi:MAG: hypothetical protein ACJA01_004590, partial [Saprospiraceae bacterium]
LDLQQYFIRIYSSQFLSPQILRKRLQISFYIA